MPKLEMRKPVKSLEHSGIMGMHWGERRFQNYDGSLTDEGRKRYGVGKPRMSKAEKLAMRQEKKAQDIINKKEKIYARGNAKEIYKNRKLFTTEEYQKAMQRAEEFNKYEKANKKEPKVDDGKMHSFKLYTGSGQESSQNQGRQNTSPAVDKRKQVIINSGDPKLVRKNISKLNDQELRSAIEHIKGRAEMDKTITSSKDLKKLEKAAKDRKVTFDGKNATDQILKGMGTVSNLFKTGTEAYNNYNMLASSINQMTGEDTLPVFRATATNFMKFNEQHNADKNAAKEAKQASNKLTVLTNQNHKWGATTSDTFGGSGVQTAWSTSSPMHKGFTSAFGEGTFSTELSSIYNPDLTMYGQSNDWNFTGSLLDD